MVRLKGIVQFLCFGRPFLFQFLMVRLKGLGKHRKNNSSNISIPYGAIKSTLTRKINTRLEIFQFLMVRLKDMVKTISFRPSKQISIPYGAIKSWGASACISARTTISIPYGAIKRSCKPIRNSRRTVISIPYGAIKSGIGFEDLLQERNFNSLWCD